LVVSELPPTTQIRPSKLAAAPALNFSGSGVSDVHSFFAGSKRSNRSSGRPELPTMPAAT